MSPKPYTLKVLNRPGKKPIRNLPDAIEIVATTTVEEAKKQIAAAARISDYNRVAILDVDKQAIFKDRNALLVHQNGVADKQEIMVKDLGPQISWRTVFLIEYFGPILIHLSWPLLRPYIYKGVRPGDALSQIQTLTMWMFVLHYVKRELETLFVHKFSNSTMPFFNVFRNSAHYWFTSGLFTAYFIYAPNARAAQPLTDQFTRNCVFWGMILYVYGEVMNLYVHVVLSKLRSRGGTERAVPRGFGFAWFTSPNYVFESISWIGVILVSRDWATIVFLIEGIYYMQQWAQQKERRYREEFGDKYKPKKYPFVPFIPAWRPKKVKK